LGGKLDLSFINDYQPVHGDLFTVLTAGSITNHFASVDLPMLSPGLVWNYLTSATIVRLGAARADFNLNGFADAGDYAVWRSMAGRTGANLAADADGNQVVNAADLAVWRANYGNVRGNVAAGAGSATAVPEPSAAALIALVSFAVWHRRKKSGPRMSRRHAD
jgi:hypothetical protein